MEDSRSLNELKLARLSAEDRALVKVGVMHPDTLRLTDEGKALLIELLFAKFKPMVVQAVTEVQEEEKKAVKKQG